MPKRVEQRKRALLRNVRDEYQAVVDSVVLIARKYEEDGLSRSEIAKVWLDVCFRFAKGAL